MASVGIRELRQHASRWLRLVEQGETIEVTDRGRPVALLTPVPSSRLEHLRAAGDISEAIGDLWEVEPLPDDGSELASEVLARLRRDER